jgi:hypothetical protein
MSALENDAILFDDNFCVLFLTKLSLYYSFIEATRLLVRFPEKLFDIWTNYECVERAIQIWNVATTARILVEKITTTG